MEIQKLLKPVGKLCNINSEYARKPAFGQFHSKSPDWRMDNPLRHNGAHPYKQEPVSVGHLPGSHSHVANVAFAEQHGFVVKIVAVMAQSSHATSQAHVINL